jgi:hypothetical protein
VSDLSAKEQANVRTAIAFLRARCGGVGPLAKALRFTRQTLRVPASPTLAFRVARLAAVPVDDVLTGRFLPAGTCPDVGTVRSMGRRWRSPQLPRALLPPNDAAARIVRRLHEKEGAPGTSRAKPLADGESDGDVATSSRGPRSALRKSDVASAPSLIMADFGHVGGRFRPLRGTCLCSWHVSSQTYKT